ncbi:MAG: hypothetical protein PHD32_00715 [Eubacteriales bacterium]|nr:hypothetical protein [Eubacteriales bacterium]
METVNVDYHQILSLNGDGITYVDEQGEKAFLSFADSKACWVDCAQRNWRGDPGSADWSASRCVCESISAADPMYYQFYGEHPLRVTFDAHRSWWRRMLAIPPATILPFRDLERRIEKAGWSVFHIA